MFRRTPDPRRNRPTAAVHLRLARVADLDDVVAFCEQHRSGELTRGRAPAEFSVLLRGNVDTVIVALREHTLLGVALCGVTRGRARLIELAVAPGPEQARLERRLLQRSLRNLRVLGLGSLDFSATSRAPWHAPAPLLPPARTVRLPTDS